MQKIIFLLLFIFPTITFGQSFTGNYRAIFFNMFSEPKTIIAEFEVKTDNSIIGKVKVGNEIKQFNGTVDKKGKFEASSVTEGDRVYKLKGKFDKENKISFIQRVQVGSGLNKSVSENGFEGTFAKFTPPPTNPPSLPFELVDSGENRIKIQHSNLFFGDEWKGFSAKIVSKMNGNTESWELQATCAYADGEQNLKILFPKYFANAKIWKSENFDTINYLEKKTNAGRNSFVAFADIYKNNPQLLGGTLEIVKETEKQIVFKLANLKIKRVAKDDFVVLNGFIYADKQF